jgi:hypothetical protein
MAASVGGHAGKRTLTLSDVQGPAVVVLGSRPYQVSDHLVSKGASFDVVAELHRTEIFGLGVAAVRRIAVVGRAWLYSTPRRPTLIEHAAEPSLRGRTQMFRRFSQSF